MVVLGTTHGGIRPDRSRHTAAAAPAPPRKNTLLHPLQSRTHDAHTQKQLKHGCTFAAEYSLLLLGNICVVFARGIRRLADC